LAELVIKIGTVGPNPAYQDGDIIAAFNQRRIRQVHAEHICDINNFGFKSDGLRPDSISRTIQDLTREYRFERISETQVNRIILATQSIETFSNPEIDVKSFVERRLNHPKHRIFGTPGSEVWYGGDTDFSNAKLNTVWQQIEAQTPNLESNFTLWPLGTQDKKSFLSIKVDDFTDEETVELTSKETDTSDPLSEIVQKRKWRVDWKSLTLPASIPDIQDRTKEVDVRNVNGLTRANVTILKPSLGRGGN
jgi:hypothetical protein